MDLPPSDIASRDVGVVADENDGTEEADHLIKIMMMMVTRWLQMPS